MPGLAERTWAKGERPIRAVIQGFLTACIILHAAEDAFAAEPSKLTKIAAGTRLDQLPTDDWSHVLIASQPRVTDGDLEEVSGIVRNYAEMFALVVLAKVEQDDGTDPPRRQIGKLGIGLAAHLDDRWVVVSGPARPNATKPELGVLSAQVLKVAEQSLADSRVVARVKTVILYDSPAVLRFGGRNAKGIVRTIVWIEPRSGQLNQVLWTLRKQPDGDLVPAWNDGVLLATPFTAARDLFVDAEQITFGIPSKTAVALARLPAGHPFVIDQALADVACREEYQVADLQKLVQRLIIAIQASR